MGMTLFFVLSGFVIHYNYRIRMSEGGVLGFWEFFVARFSRLYPLYFVLMAWEIYNQGYMDRAWQGDEAQVEKLLVAFPYYLTLTQSWFFLIVGDFSLIYQFHRVGSIAWSISTEWFFYFSYPLICYVVVRLRGPWLKILAIAATSIVSLTCISLVAVHLPGIDDYGLSRFGKPATTLLSTQDSIYRWLLYFSPYSRVMEFLLGVLVCGIYIDLRSVAVGALEKFWGRLAPSLALLSLALIHVAMFAPSHPFPGLTKYHMCYGYALPVALLIFSIARYDDPVRQLLSSKVVVAIGEASYSLYFLHLLVIGFAQDHGFLAHSSGWSLTFAWSVVLILTLVALLASLVSYRVIEVPARRWFRTILMGGSAISRSPGWLRAAVPASRGAVVSCLIIVPLAIILLRPPQKLIPPPEGSVEILSATYGKSCGAPADNALKSVVNRCSGTLSCDYKVDVFKLGDPASGCAKDFDVTWRCGRNDVSSTSRVEGEAGLGGKGVLLTCVGRKAASGL